MKFATQTWPARDSLLKIAPVWSVSVNEETHKPVPGGGWEHPAQTTSARTLAIERHEAIQQGKVEHTRQQDSAGLEAGLIRIRLESGVEHDGSKHRCPEQIEIPGHVQELRRQTHGDQGQ